MTGEQTAQAWCKCLGHRSDGGMLTVVGSAPASYISEIRSGSDFDLDYVSGVVEGKPKDQLIFINF